MNQAVFTGKDFDEGPVGHDADDLAVVDLTSLDAKLLRKAQDALDSRFSSCRFSGRDGDGAIVFDVDLGARFLLDGPDHLPTWANDCSDLLRINLETNHSGRESRQLSSRLVNRLRHLSKNEEPAVSGLGKRFPHDLRCNAFDLDVHLDGSDTIGRPRDLKVHITEGVFHALDIAQNGVLPSLGFGYESHSDASDRSADRNSGVHEGQRAPADACHRFFLVRTGDLRDKPHRVGELFRAWYHG